MNDPLTNHIERKDGGFDAGVEWIDLDGLHVGWAGWSKDQARAEAIGARYAAKVAPHMPTRFFSLWNAA